jgi:hypothetical protein
VRLAQIHPVPGIWRPCHYATPRAMQSASSSTRRNARRTNAMIVPHRGPPSFSIFTTRSPQIRNDHFNKCRYRWMVRPPVWPSGRNVTRQTSPPAFCGVAIVPDDTTADPVLPSPVGVRLMRHRQAIAFA